MIPYSRIWLAVTQALVLLAHKAPAGMLIG